MSSTFSSLSDPRFETRVDLSFIFAKISCVTDDAPMSTYEESCSALVRVTELLTFLSSIIDKDVFLLGTLSEYLVPRLNKIVSRIFIKSFLDTCITEMWNQRLHAEVFVSFVSFFKTIAKIGNTLNLQLSKTYKKTVDNDDNDEKINRILLITDANKIEIIDKLFVVSAQHPELYRSKTLPETSSPSDYETAKIKKSLNLFEMCIETVLNEDVSPSVEIVRHLTEKYMAANSFRKEVKLFLIRDHLEDWQRRLIVPDSHHNSSAKISQLVELRNRIVLNNEENLTVELYLLARSINKLILRFRYLNGELKDELAQQVTLDPIISISNKPEQPTIEDSIPGTMDEPKRTEKAPAPHVTSKPKEEDPTLGGIDGPNVEEFTPAQAEAKKSTAPSKKSLFKYLRKGMAHRQR